eukprot:6193287-Pleurochrysis_carterae.AAC.1
MTNPVTRPAPTNMAVLPAAAADDDDNDDDEAIMLNGFENGHLERYGVPRQQQVAAQPLQPSDMITSHHIFAD